MWRARVGSPTDPQEAHAIAAELLIILLLTLANGFFAGAEIAIVALRRSRLAELVESGRTSARAVQALRDQPERFLATVQIGITVISATAAAFGGASVAKRLEPVLERYPLTAPYAEELALGAVVVAVSYLSIVLGELVPKSLALRSSEAYALLVGRALLGIAFIARPIVWFLTASSNLILRPFGDRTNFTETRHSSEELQQLVQEASKAGTLHPGAGEIAQRALEFAELSAGDVMIPRQEVVAIPKDATNEELRRILLEHTHTRMPVYEGTIDNVTGYVSVKDLLALAFEQKLIVLQDVIRPPYFVPETRLAVDLLEDMRKKRMPFAIVVDERGGMAGIITTEDLIEELVGEIFSEHATLPPETMRREADGSVATAASVPLRELNRAFDLELPEEGDWTTVGGLVVAHFGRIPVTGERVRIAPYELEVADASPRRVRRVRIRLLSPDVDA